MPGKIDYTKLDTPPEEHEVRVAIYFAKRGKDIIFLKPGNIPDVHTPDFRMDDVEWEVKSPKGDSKRTFENNIRKAMTQSRYIIFDLRRCRLDEKSAITQLESFFKVKGRIKRMLIITKKGELIEKKGDLTIIRFVVFYAKKKELDPLL